MLAAIFGAIETGAGYLRRRVNTPGRPARLQQCGVNGLGVAGLEGQVDRARVFVVKQYALPFLAAIFGIEDAALGIGSIRVSQRRNKDFLRVAGIDENPRNLARILETDM